MNTSYKLIQYIIQDNHASVIDSIREGADVNEIHAIDVSGEGLSPLIAACMLGRTEIAKILIKNNADCSQIVSGGEGICSKTPLIVASINGHIDIVNILLSSGANINWKNEVGDTILDIINRKIESKNPFKSDNLRKILDILKNKRNC